MPLIFLFPLDWKKLLPLKLEYSVSDIDKYTAEQFAVVAKGDNGNNMQIFKA